MLENNEIFKLCVPSSKDCIAIDSTKINLTDLRAVSINWMRKVVTIEFLAPLSIHNNLVSVFSFPGTIELSPVICNVKMELCLDGNVVPGVLNKVVYNSREHMYLMEVQFSLLDVKLFNEYINSVIKKKENKNYSNDDKLGELLDLE